MSLDNQEAPLTIRHWMLQALMTTAIVCAILFGLAFLFLPDGVMDKGQSPAISSTQEYHDTQELQQRIALLEQRLQHQAQQQERAEAASLSASATDTNTTSEISAADRVTSDLVVADHLNQNRENTVQQLNDVAAEAKEYEQRLQQLQEESARESLTARMIFGVMQLKNAYENDDTLASSIALLKQSVQDEQVQEKLLQLENMLQDNLPSRQDILSNIHQLQDNLTAPKHNAAEAPQNTTQQDWMGSIKDRAQNLAGQLVQIRPTEQVQQVKILDRISQAVNVSDYSLATQLATHLPATPNTKTLMTKLQSRAKAQNLMQGIVSSVTNLVSSPNRKGALY